MSRCSRWSPPPTAKTLGWSQSKGSPIRSCRWPPSTAPTPAGRATCSQPSPSCTTRTWLCHGQHSPQRWLRLSEESSGTQALVSVVLSFYEAIHKGGLLLVDEIETSLHPNIARGLVQSFQERGHPPQLVFTTHDSQMLDSSISEPLLRKDQVWLTEKSEAGATELYSLADVHTEPEEDLEDAYLSGAFGGVPYLGALVRLPKGQTP